MFAGDLKLHWQMYVMIMEHERKPAQCITLEIAGPNLGSLIQTVVHDTSPGFLTHSAHLRIIVVKKCNAIWRKRLYQFTLGKRNALWRSKGSEVSGANVGDNRPVRTNNATQPGEFAHPFGPHLQHGIAVLRF